MGQSSNERNELREAAFASVPEDDRRIVEFRGRKYEVRAPSLAQQRLASKRATDKDTGVVDPALEGVNLLIGCVYVPDTNELVFETADRDALMAMPQTTRGLQFTLTKALRDLVNEGAKADDEVEKN